MTLEFLRKRAKKLLRDVHAREPLAVERVYRWHPEWKRFYKQTLSKCFKLADAQWIIARELDFASWPKLKAALESGAALHEPDRPENPYLEIVDQVAASSSFERVRLGNILSPLPGRRPLENRGKRTSDQKLEALLEGLRHESPKVRRFCLELLDNSPDPRARPHVLRCLEDPVPRVRWHAVHALGCDVCKDGARQLSDAERARLREIAVQDPSPKVRSEARAALARDQARTDDVEPPEAGKRC